MLFVGLSLKIFYFSMDVSFLLTRINTLFCSTTLSSLVYLFYITPVMCFIGVVLIGAFKSIQVRKL